jgi:23S rRNA (adenine2030-N6)-methyltransferase
MFSYRHAFHAGNHADVLKHLVLIHSIQYLQEKDAAVMLVDTHAGAGIYSLRDGYAALAKSAKEGSIAYGKVRSLINLTLEGIGR